ncbi:PEP-CTERM sorting domain-containing protein [Rubritalea tangerina]|uniref:PEP-CTERM sorting domain-containing protein n=1 Tax=Rubritalea tangerina TaxID=430798 RepID=A0ABW4ZA31_9BACT
MKKANTPLAAALFLAGSLATNAASISVNIHINTNDANMVDAGESAFVGLAGAEVVDGANVNNYKVDTTSNQNNLVDNSGASTSVALADNSGYSSFVNNSFPNQATTGDAGLTQSAGFINDSEAYTLTNLNSFASSYTLILLFEIGNDSGGALKARNYGFTVNDGNGPQSVFTNDTASRDLDLTNDGSLEYLLASGGSIGAGTVDGNYAVFTGLSGDTLSISGAQSSSRSPLLGFQVVSEVASIPEPSISALLGLGGVALILRRRK